MTVPAAIRSGILTLSAAVVLLTGPRAADAAFDPGHYAQRRALLGVDQPGFYRAEIDVSLYRALSGKAQAAQLRIVDAKGEQAPFLVRMVRAPRMAASREATLVDPLSLPSGEASVVLDFGTGGLKHSELTLSVDVPEPRAGQDGNFLRHVRIERSDDERRFQLLSDTETIYRASSSHTSSESLLVRYPVSDARYLRIVILPGADRQRLVIRGARPFFAPAEARAPERTLPARIDKTGHDPETKTSWATLDLEAPGVPLSGLSLELGGASFERFVTLEASNEPPLWVASGTGWVVRALPGARGGRTEQEIRLPLSTLRRHLRVTFQDGDDPALALRAAAVIYQPEEIAFEAREAGAYTLLLDTDVPEEPAFDFAARLRRQGEVSWRPAAFGAIERVGRNPRPAVQPPAPRSERLRPYLTAGLVVVLAGLGLWTLRLLKRR